MTVLARASSNLPDRNSFERSHDSKLGDKNLVMSPAGPGTKNDRAGEGQQQFTRN
jgi:hypothetical protein